MCGIAGIIEISGTDVKESDLQILQEVMKYRGPDNFDIWQNGQIGFVHRRLSIIDLSKEGNQPFEIEYDGVKYVMTFNGEIYNFKIIKDKLSSFKINFRSETDTEVILWAYILLGEDIIKEFRGMFAFAIHDPKNNQVIFARDHFGKKPLYYGVLNGRFVFSSDIRGIKAISSGVSLNFEALSYYFSEMSSPQPLTIWNDVYQLRPGHIMILDLDSFETDKKAYSSFQSETNENQTFEEAENLVQSELYQAITKRQMSDVPLGYFLSGGVDSGLIVALAGQQSKISTYSVGYENSEISELDDAKAMALRYKTDHHELIIQPKIEADLEHIIDEFGEPFADASAIPSYYIAQEMRKNVKVAISGDGGDETFGYASYAFFHEADTWAKGKSTQHIKRAISLSKLSSRIGMGENLGKYSNVLNPVISKSELYKRGMAFTNAELELLFSDKQNYKFTDNYMENVWKEAEGDSVTSKVISGSYRTRLLNDYLVKVDRSSMANSLEVRSPFLDFDFVQKMHTIPNEYKLKNGVPKYILKKLAEKLIDSNIMNRPKKGFSVPINDWMKTDLKDKVNYYLSEEKLKKYDFLNTEYILQIKNDFLNSGLTLKYKVWTVLVFVIWAEKNLD
jgi:asparagine synthase (glutamine-hydrolysing)